MVGMLRWKLIYTRLGIYARIEDKRAFYKGVLDILYKNWCLTRDQNGLICTQKKIRITKKDIKKTQCKLSIF